MGLSFGGEGGAGRIDLGSPSFLDNLGTGTAVFWCYLNSVPATAASYLFNKGTGGAGNRLRFSITNAPNITLLYDRNVTDLNVTTDPNNFSAFGINKWMCIVATWDINGVNADQKILIGDLSNIPAAPSSYSTQVVGSNTHATDAAANFFIGNDATANLGWNGIIASVKMFNTVLTLGQIYQIWRNFPQGLGVAGKILDLNFFSGTEIRKFSGQAHSVSLTGTSDAAHVPLGLFTDQAPDTPYVVSAGAFSQTVSGTITPTGSVTPALNASAISVGGTITPVGVIQEFGVGLNDMEGFITPSGALIASLTLLVSEQFDGTITPTGSLNLQANKNLGGTITPAGSLQVPTFRSSLAGTITPTSTLNRSLVTSNSGGGGAGTIRRRRR